MNKKNTSRDANHSDEKERIMNAFSLLNATYHSANKLGEGTFGAVTTVYNDDGEMFAMKTFDLEIEEVSDEENDDEIYEFEYGTQELGTLRELSVLRMFSKILPNDAAFEHPGIMRIHDITCIRDRLCMIMPKASCDLTRAIKNGTLSNPQKLIIAYYLLHTLAFLHTNQIIHRDIKCDNILLNDAMLPILADFSLAKLFDSNLSGTTHTPGPGTPTYKAPEVYKEEGYGLSADVFSLGVCLFELFNGILTLDRDKAALSFLEGIRAKMSKDKPIPMLLFRMLDPDPKTRITALASLDNPAFEKLRAKISLPPIVKVVEKMMSEKQDHQILTKKQKKRQTGQQQKIDTGGDIGKLMRVLEFSNPITQMAAKVYHQKSGVPAEHCLILAGRLYEAELLSMGCVTDYLQDFNISEYVDFEMKILKAMDFCLFI
jgi:serine/threonine protein kinase